MGARRGLNRPKGMSGFSAGLSSGSVSTRPYYPAPYYVYAAPACYWQPAYWVNQPYGDGWGRFTYVLQWIPAPYVCY
jgi:hypothetical protein